MAMLQAMNEKHGQQYTAVGPATNAMRTGQYYQQQQQQKPRRASHGGNSTGAQDGAYYALQQRSRSLPRASYDGVLQRPGITTTMSSVAHQEAIGGYEYYSHEMGELPPLDDDDLANVHTRQYDDQQGGRPQRLVSFRVMERNFKD